jgi:hypothetical protein
METNIGKSDAIPLINLEWSKLFVTTFTNKNAIHEQGWYPANWKLLQSQDPKNKNILNNWIQQCNKSKEST